MGQGRDDSRGRPWVLKSAFVSVGILAVTAGADWARAMHEVDHRFTVEGHVCNADGQPAAEAEVVVKDTRAAVGATVFSDSRGQYKATLHLHNDNQGDPILVTALGQEQKTTAQFDPNDIKVERKVTVDIGKGCVETQEASRGLYYGAGVAAVALGAGAWMVRARRRDAKRGKGSRK